MDITGIYVTVIETVLNGIGMTHEMAHLHGGLAIYVGVQMLLRTRRASAIALQAVAGAEIINEVLEYGHYGSWRLPDTAQDIVMTLFWPTLLFLLAKYRRARWGDWMVRRKAEKGAPKPRRAVPGLVAARARTRITP
ncbi:MAG TPA: hypothetical protein VF503_17895 [Sphingobium sp.]|uniref:hypothetical protein n=1 Tax=Sphingobium sp. TaxID=1912891 RepID=UPI002ED5262E